ncbi:hypothetical protein [Plasmodium yoelii yoelii]|uniref:Uncharacterized protein n=1 Tax=Plasmodium yoelii yoelii TaxID=73239 RepID=Q7RPA0_PLAYO|nr:hypothetical protein [Plasmodium yoelii yoelii]
MHDESDIISVLEKHVFNFILKLLDEKQKKFILNSNISTKRRRYFKIRKHQKKKYKKKRMGLSTIPWIPRKEKIRTYKLPNQSRLINKRFMRDKKGGRRYHYFTLFFSHIFVNIQIIL